jgi:glycosyltransferase involved in cell wall biosynthesis
VGKRPTISVIIPAFNASETLGRALSSVLEQDTSSVEIIVVNDTSTDNTGEVADKFAARHPIIRAVHHPANAGGGAAKNTGIAAATGDFLLFLDADDTLNPESLPALIAFLNSQPTDLVLIGCEEVRRHRARPLTDGPQLSLAERAPFTAAGHPESLFWPPSPWSKVYRREFIAGARCAFPEGVFEDIVWSARTTIEAASIQVYLPVVYRYLTAGADSSITTRANEGNMARIGQVQRLRSDISVESLLPNLQTSLSALATIHLLWGVRGAYKTLPEELQETFFHQAADELSWWHERYPVPPGLDTTPLMSAVDRHSFSRALLANDWGRWQKTLDASKAKKKFRRVFRPGRLFGRPS